MPQSILGMARVRAGRYAAHSLTCPSVHLPPTLSLDKAPAFTWILSTCSSHGRSGSAPSSSARSVSMHDLYHSFTLRNLESSGYVVSKKSLSSAYDLSSASSHAIALPPASAGIFAVEIHLPQEYSKKFVLCREQEVSKRELHARPCTSTLDTIPLPCRKAFSASTDTRRFRVARAQRHARKHACIRRSHVCALGYPFPSKGPR
jgi:hypothetical protein